MDNNDFVCQIKGCNTVFRKPILLICGKIVCQQHNKYDNETFKCRACFGNHAKANGDFQLSNTLPKILDKKIENFNTETEKSFNQVMENIQFMVHEFDLNCQNSFLPEYMKEILKKIDKSKMDLIDKIIDMTDRFKDEVEHIEILCQQIK
jgi:hypothetical protein